MRSENSIRNCKPSCCGSCRKANSRKSAVPRRSGSTSAWWRPPIAIFTRPSRRGSFVPICTIASPCFPLKSPPYGCGEDIPLLVWHFILKKRIRLGKTIDNISAQVMNALVEYDWPGNVRELENVIERAMILSPRATLVLEESFQPARKLRPETASHLSGASTGPILSAPCRIVSGGSRGPAMPRSVSG